ncbi:MAG: DUF1285 domain-containing protein [Pseudotabrizicola sp.]|uniref:DUF1285 domain-containing protein n=1 Tax=Pseudotabrizicola sp. TaxID=2939647 RepID=UPI00271F5A66|nr:DUF1285 domain-containing protein [Pseudotabrizicola sp.]MDO8881607.1 DUF1285 domain-containing protein [Pseudotabrizicola sp.]MDP2079979.1 DUF1285 domain-containing protein [Pseudotabrizicola sp.]MDZ7575424.1 DUF1285 domain-containing protein [Pseudotabrizicola sp.]
MPNTPKSQTVADTRVVVSPDGLSATLAALPKKGPPPVHLWNPPYCGEMDMRIARDGTWFHEGTPIGRVAMVKLFSSILKREGDRFYLVTPVEKVGIQVDDTPFLAVDLLATGAGRDQNLTFSTKTEDEVLAGPDHAIRITLDPATAEPAPFVHIRGGMEARIDRKTFYRLVDLGTQEDVDGTPWFGVWSAGVFFPMTRSADLP